MNLLFGIILFASFKGFIGELDACTFIFRNFNHAEVYQGTQPPTVIDVSRFNDVGLLIEELRKNTLGNIWKHFDLLNEPVKPLPSFYNANKVSNGENTPVENLNNKMAKVLEEHADCGGKEYGENFYKLDVGFGEFNYGLHMLIFMTLVLMGKRLVEKR